MTVHRIRIENKDGIGHTTLVTNAETGEYIPGVRKIELTFDCDTTVKAILHCIQVEADLDNIAVDEIITTHVAPGKESYITHEKIDTDKKGE